MLTAVISGQWYFSILLSCLFVLFVVNIIFIMRDENLCTFLLGNIGLPFFSFGSTVIKAY